MANRTALIAGAFYAVLALGLFARSQLTPAYNWDIIGYVAAVKAIECSNQETVHAFTYSQIQASVPAQVFKDLTSPVLGEVVWTDPAALMEVLPFYRIRPAYTGTVYVFWKLGVPVVFATHLVSGLAVAIGLGLLFLIGRKLLSPPFLFALPVMAWVVGIASLSRLSTPDGLAFLGMMAATYAFVRERRALWVVLPLLIAVRTDLIVFTVPFVILLYLAGYRRDWVVGTTLLSAVALFFFIHIYFDNPGWQTTFANAFPDLGHGVRPFLGPRILTLHEYLAGLSWGLRKAVYEKPLVLYLLCLWFSFFLMRTRCLGGNIGSFLRSKSVVLAILAASYIGTHFVIFPDVDGRFYVGSYLIGWVALFAALSQQFAQQSEFWASRPSEPPWDSPARGG